MKTLSALEVRKKFGSVLDMVAEKRIPIAIARGGKRLVVMVPADEYEKRMESREARLRLAVAGLDAWKRQHRDKLRGLDAVKLLRESRDQR